jgi:DNA invertase Pin-like site-specific DNA recombinase
VFAAIGILNPERNPATPRPARRFTESGHELDRLLSAVIAEQKRRGKKLATAISQPRRAQVVTAAPLTRGKLNAVRAAFKAGVTPSRIARQFGISQSDVRKALASNTGKR